jgi:hypothetical protein
VSGKIRIKKISKLVIITLIFALLSSVVFALLSGALNLNGNPQTPTLTPSPTSIINSPTPSPDQIPLQILRKQIPAGYEMGNTIDMNLRQGMSVVFINNIYEKVSIAFTAQSSGAVSEVSIKAMSMGRDSLIRVGIQESISELPSGYWMTMDGYGTILLTNSSSFKTALLKSPVQLIKGQVYFIIIEPAENTLTDKLAISTYLENALFQPLNRDDPDILQSDSSINTFTFDGESWRQENKWPIFVLDFLDGSCTGQPYSLLAPWVVYGSTQVGQAVIPASDYRIGNIAFLMGLKGATPQDKLIYDIRDSNNDVLREGVLAEVSQVTAKPQWVEVSLSSPLTLEAGELYRIVVYSPGTSFDNAYHLFGHEFSFNNAIGYGGVQHQLTSSYTNGSTWTNNPDADAVFTITTS